MARGRKTGGRRKGVQNRRTVARREALETAASQLRQELDVEAGDALEAFQTSPVAPVAIPETVDWFRGDAHALLRRIYVDPRLPLDMRIDAAKSAIRFERPALIASHVQHSNAPSRTVLAAMSTEQLRELLLSMDSNEATIEGEAADSTALPAPEDEE